MAAHKVSSAPFQVSDKPYIKACFFVNGGESPNEYAVALNDPANYYPVIAQIPSDDHEEESNKQAQRITDCLNACAGIADPESTIETVKQWLATVSRLYCGELEQGAKQLLAELEGK